MDLQDRKRAIAFAVAVFGVSGLTVWALLHYLGGLAGLIAGLAIAPMIGYGLYFIYDRTTPGRVTRSGEVVAGSQSCPECGSLQTDKVSRYTPSGKEVFSWRCFACDADWNP